MCYSGKCKYEHYFGDCELKTNSRSPYPEDALCSIKEYSEYLEQRKNAPINEVAKELAKIYIEKVVILSEKIRNILLRNGVKIKMKIIDGEKYLLKNGVIVTMKMNPIHRDLFFDISLKPFIFNAYVDSKEYSIEAYKENGEHYHFAYEGFDIVKHIEPEDNFLVETVENSLLKYIFSMKCFFY